VADGA